MKSKKDLFTKLVVIEGCKFSTGYINKAFLLSNRKNSVTTNNNNSIDNHSFSRMSIEYDKPLILLCKDIIDDAYDILLIMDKYHSANRSLLIIVTDIIHETLDFMIDHYKNANTQIIGIKASGAGTYRKYPSQDTSMLTDAKILTPIKKFKTQIMDNEEMNQLTNNTNAQEIEQFTSTNTNALGGKDDGALYIHECQLADLDECNQIILKLLTKNQV